jgi:hypothetical protein
VSLYWHDSILSFAEASICMIFLLGCALHFAYVSRVFCPVVITQCRVAVSGFLSMRGRPFSSPPSMCVFFCKNNSIIFVHSNENRVGPTVVRIMRAAELVVFSRIGLRFQVRLLYW